LASETKQALSFMLETFFQFGYAAYDDILGIEKVDVKSCKVKVN
jgi:hypothetical protein